MCAVSTIFLSDDVMAISEPAYRLPSEALPRDMQHDQDQQQHRANDRECLDLALVFIAWP